MEQEPVLRHTARVLLLDDLDRVLLFRGQDPTDSNVRFWFPPGGGIEYGETPEEAARREVWEETGLSDLILGPHIWNRRHVVAFNGTHFDIREVWFFARVPNFEIDTSGFTELERRTVPEHRWWTQRELESTTELLTPRELTHLLEDILLNGLPKNPVTVQICSQTEHRAETRLVVDAPHLISIACLVAALHHHCDDSFMSLIKPFSTSMGRRQPGVQLLPPNSFIDARTQ